VKTTWK